MISPESLPVLPPALDYAGVAVFALTGALAAARDRQDIVTFWFFAVVTGVGGGTLRDLLIGAPVFWVGDATYLGIGLAAALIVWFLAPHLERRKTLIWLDALGLAVYAVIGAAKAISLGVGPFVSIAMGVLTATFGGVIRDVLAGQPSALLKREITISAALTAAAGFVALDAAGVPPLWAGAAGAIAGFGVRAGAIHYGWALPAFGVKSDKREA
ncbi:MAG TPA: trimeric intracellular cation channel family protein [Vitreimonas sp.]|uniref:trimeric intracellular cation channel family protein n=1 Tax=Vitreimonas sp. TaxID=3069702 RepID=UPI002D56A3A8|nr:trimeric intracellular cation channel family protein [Vitreimonas sp.]HYD88543.1 trimeric intracellular cation channel family protein [Vitreimonas sp.]